MHIEVGTVANCQVSYTGCTKSPSNPTSFDAWVSQVATNLTDLSCQAPILRWTRMKQTIVPGVDQLMTWHAKVLSYWTSRLLTFITVSHHHIKIVPKVSFHVCVSWDDSRNYIMLLENAHVFLSFSWYTFDGETEGETNWKINWSMIHWSLEKLGPIKTA
jgi:hypothetical protein